MSDYSAESRRLARKLADKVSKKLAGSGRTLARDAKTGRYVIQTLSENGSASPRTTGRTERTLRAVQQRNAAIDGQPATVAPSNGQRTKNAVVRNGQSTKKVVERNGQPMDLTGSNGRVRSKTSRSVVSGKSGQASKRSSL